ncbi:inheritance of peroxisomes protein 1-domain-containing protein [Halenospora varia]|nr:inheritance of peroxisomes protein 1-domain-containing protein [Halenospora varia]
MDSSPVLKRSFSLPPSRSASSPDPQVEVLFNLPSVRIVAFTTSASPLRPGSNNGSPIVEDAPGTLPWVSRFERTIAIGPLRIYRAPGSVAFLNCANALQPILPKSQCWCVDGDSKFVLQIRRPQYWRIEVPNKDLDEKQRVEELKEVLSKVLLFEKTPCPFQRHFTVQLPEAPQTPVKKKPWKPVIDPSSSPVLQPNCLENGYGFGLVETSSTQSRPATPRPETPTPEKIMKISDTSATVTEIHTGTGDSVPKKELDFEPEDQLPKQKLPIISPSTPPKTPEPILLVERSLEIESSPSALSVASQTTPSLLEFPVTPTANDEVRGEVEDSDSFSDATDDTNITPRSQLQPSYQALVVEPEAECRPQALQNCTRSVTAPPVLSLITSPPSKHRQKSPLRSSVVAESDSGFSSSVESFHSTQSWHSPLDPSPETAEDKSESPKYPYPHDTIVLPKRGHNRQTSEITTSPQTPGAWESAEEPDDSHSDQSNLSPLPTTPTLTADAGEKSDEENTEVVTPPAARPSIRHRATTSSNSRRRELSPLPAAVNLFSPPPRRSSRRMQTARHIPTAIIQTTCKILLSPPSHLINLMLNIASKIAAGEWRGFLFSGYGEVHWDFEDEYADTNVWTEDDYGIAIPPSNTKVKRTSQNNEAGGSWEVD